MWHSGLLLPVISAHIAGNETTADGAERMGAECQNAISHCAKL